MSLQKAVEEIVSAISGGDQAEDDCQLKANIIIGYAERVSDEVLARAGFTKNTDSNIRFANQLASAVDSPFESSGAAFNNSLQLMAVPSDLSARDSGYIKVDHELVFEPGRVLDWDLKHERPKRVMTYEEAARLVVFWLAEKILQIIRKNNWDRVKELPDLYDRLAAFLVA